MKIGYVEGEKRQVCSSRSVKALDPVWEIVLQEWVKLSVSDIEKIYEKTEVIWGDGSCILSMLFKTKQGKFMGISGYRNLNWKQSSGANRKISAKTHKELVRKWYKPMRERELRVQRFKKMMKMSVDELMELVGLTPTELKREIIEQINHIRRHEGEIEMVEEDFEK